MNVDELEQLSQLGDSSKEATSLRLRAARRLTGLGQDALARDMGGRMTKQKVYNAETGANYPPIELMRYFYRRHRIDFNFMLYGELAQLPSDVYARLVAALRDVHNELDRKRDSEPEPETEPQ